MFSSYESENIPSHFAILSARAFLSSHKNMRDSIDVSLNSSLFWLDSIFNHWPYQQIYSFLIRCTEPEHARIWIQDCFNVGSCYQTLLPLISSTNLVHH